MAVAASTVLTSCLIDRDKACDENQVHVETRTLDYCACAPGFVPDTVNGAGCIVPSTIDAGMLDAAPNGVSGEGGATSCSMSNPCPEAQRCEQGVCSAVAGLDKSCTSAADCAGTDATFCNNFLPSPVCVVPDCAADTALCPTGYVCCAIAASSSCARGAACPPPTMLVP